MSEKRLIQLEAAIKALTKRIEMVEQGEGDRSPKSWYERPTFKPNIGVGEKPNA